MVTGRTKQSCKQHALCNWIPAAGCLKIQEKTVKECIEDGAPHTLAKSIPGVRIQVQYEAQTKDKVTSLNHQ